MIVDCAHYKDGARQHEGALNPEQAAEIAERAREGEFIWIGCTSRSQATSTAWRTSSTCTNSPSRTRCSPPAPEDRGLPRALLHRPEDGPLPRGPGGGPLRRDPHLRRPELHDHGPARSRQRARLGSPSTGGVRTCSAWVPPRRSGRSSTRLSTTTSRSSTRSRTTSRRSRPRCSTTTSPPPPSASTTSSAR